MRVVCLHPEDVRVPGLLGVAQGAVKAVSLSKDEIVACMVRSGMLYVPFTAESFNDLFTNNLIPRLSQEVAELLPR